MSDAHVGLQMPVIPLNCCSLKLGELKTCFLKMYKEPISPKHSDSQFHHSRLNPPIGNEDEKCLTNQAYQQRLAWLLKRKRCAHLK